MEGQAAVVRLRSTLAIAVAAVFWLTAAAAGADVDWSKAQLVTVTAVEYDFQPSHLSFHHGVPYRLHLENHGKEVHELTAPEFFKSALIQDPAVLARDGTDLVVQPGESKDVLFVPQKPGHFSLICADHDWAGMTGDITVD
jgi:uncharacterized cupredoxin-like copper-binding protein